MKGTGIDRKTFVGMLGKAGAATCVCAAVGGMRELMAENPAPREAKPSAAAGGEGAAQAARRLEFEEGWLRRFFAAVDQTLDEPARRRLLEANGRACYENTAPPQKEIAGPDALESFRAWIAAKGPASGYRIQGDTISFEFPVEGAPGQPPGQGRCLCPMAVNQGPGTLSPTFCACSVGYVRAMHERLLGRKVAVGLVESVLRGAKRCRFTLRMT